MIAPVLIYAAEDQGTERETGWGIKLCQNFVQLGWWVNYESTKFDYSTPNNDFVLQVHKKREAWTGTFSPCLSFPQCLVTKQDLLRVIWHRGCKKNWLQEFFCKRVFIVQLFEMRRKTILFQPYLLTTLSINVTASNFKTRNFLSM